MSQINFSIILPVYNEGSRLSETLNCLIDFPFTDYEIVIIDDGSSDVTPRICDQYASKHDFINVFHTKNRGCLAARILGIQKANGVYLTFVDGDDYVDSDYMNNLHDAISHKADFYLFNNKIISKTSSKQIEEKDFLTNGFVSKTDVYKWIVGGKFAAPWDKIYKRELFESLNNVKYISFGDDEYLNLLYMNNIKKIYVHNSSSYIHVIDSATSISSHNISIKRLSEIDTLFVEGLKILHSQNASRHICDLFYSVQVSTFSKTLGLLFLAGYSPLLLKKALLDCSLASYKAKLKNYPCIIYMYILTVRHKLPLLAGLIVKIRSLLK